MLGALAETLALALLLAMTMAGPQVVFMVTGHLAELARIVAWRLMLRSYSLMQALRAPSTDDSEVDTSCPILCFEIVHDLDFYGGLDQRDYAHSTLVRVGDRNVIPCKLLRRTLSEKEGDFLKHPFRGLLILQVQFEIDGRTFTCGGHDQMMRLFDSLAVTVENENDSPGMGDVRVCRFLRSALGGHVDVARFVVMDVNGEADPVEVVELDLKASVEGLAAKFPLVDQKIG